MRNALLTLCAVSALSGSASAQAHLVGRQDVVWANTTWHGTRELAARVCYPAPTSGFQVPVLPRAGGWPVIVFLHGFAHLGRDYHAIGDAWASAGFIVVQLDTAQWSFLTLWDDGIAMFGALAAATAAPGTRFSGAFDMQRVGLAGHSMGGGTAGLVLASNPGYRCGFVLAPVFPGIVPSGMVAVPFGAVAGTGDAITPVGTHAEPFYAAVASEQGFKFLYTMDLDCDHMNVAGLATGASPAVFERVADVGTNFFRLFLLDDANAVERCIGPAALAEPRLVELAQQIVEPRVWAPRPLRIGRRARVSLAAEEGLGGILVASSTAAPIATSIGTLLLDPASGFMWTIAPLERPRRIDAVVEVPNDPLLIGLTVAFQAIGPTPSDPLLLGTAVQYVVTP